MENLLDVYFYEEGLKKILGNNPKIQGKVNFEENRMVV